MIKLVRWPIPRDVMQRLQARKKRLLQLLAANAMVPPSVADGYKDPDLKAILLAETHKKCAYCESFFTHVYFGDVEHIVPKGIFPEQMLDAENLTIACALCNGEKGDYASSTFPLLNPFVDEPAAHLIVLGPVIFSLPTSDRGRLTVETLGLNRADLIARRVTHLRRLEPLVREFVRTPDGTIKNLLLSVLQREVASECEYVAVSRGFLKSLGIDFPYGQVSSS